MAELEHELAVLRALEQQKTEAQEAVLQALEERQKALEHLWKLVQESGSTTSVRTPDSPALLPQIPDTLEDIVGDEPPVSSSPGAVDGYNPAGLPPSSPPPPPPPPAAFLSDFAILSKQQQDILGQWQTEIRKRERRRQRSQRRARQQQMLIAELRHPYTGIEVKDRRWRLRKYASCFLGSQLVDWLIQRGWADTRAKAVRVGRGLARAGVFYHVAKTNLFEDGSSFYRLRSPQEVRLYAHRKQKPSNPPEKPNRRPLWSLRWMRRSGSPETAPTNHPNHPSQLVGRPVVFSMGARSLSAVLSDRLARQIEISFHSGSPQEQMHYLQGLRQNVFYLSKNDRPSDGWNLRHSQAGVLSYTMSRRQRLPGRQNVQDILLKKTVRVKTGQTPQDLLRQFLDPHQRKLHQPLLDADGVETLRSLSSTTRVLYLPFSSRLMSTRPCYAAVFQDSFRTTEADGRAPEHTAPPPPPAPIGKDGGGGEEDSKSSDGVSGSVSQHEFRPSSSASSSVSSRTAGDGIGAGGRSSTPGIRSEHSGGGSSLQRSEYGVDFGAFHAGVGEDPHHPWAFSTPSPMPLLSSSVSSQSDSTGPIVSASSLSLKPPLRSKKKQKKGLRGMRWMSRSRRKPRPVSESAAHTTHADPPAVSDHTNGPEDHSKKKAGREEEGGGGGGGGGGEKTSTEDSSAETELIPYTHVLYEISVRITDPETLQEQEGPVRKAFRNSPSASASSSSLLDASGVHPSAESTGSGLEAGRRSPTPTPAGKGRPKAWSISSTSSPSRKSRVGSLRTTPKRLEVMLLAHIFRPLPPLLVPATDEEDGDGGQNGGRDDLALDTVRQDLDYFPRPRSPRGANPTEPLPLRGQTKAVRFRQSPPSSVVAAAATATVTSSPHLPLSHSSSAAQRRQKSRRQELEDDGNDDEREQEEGEGRDEEETQEHGTGEGQKEEESPSQAPKKRRFREIPRTEHSLITQVDFPGPDWLLDLWAGRTSAQIPTAVMETVTVGLQESGLQQEEEDGDVGRVNTSSLQRREKSIPTPAPSLSLDGSRAIMRPQPPQLVEDFYHPGTPDTDETAVERCSPELGDGSIQAAVPHPGEEDEEEEEMLSDPDDFDSTTAAVRVRGGGGRLDSDPESVDGEEEDEEDEEDLANLLGEEEEEEEEEEELIGPGNQRRRSSEYERLGLLCESGPFTRIHVLRRTSDGRVFAAKELSHFRYFPPEGAEEEERERSRERRPAAAAAELYEEDSGNSDEDDVPDLRRYPKYTQHCRAELEILLHLAETSGHRPGPNAGPGRTHPYIAGLHDWITSRSGTWLVLDWASEGDLFSYIHSRGCVPEATLGSQWTAQLVCALRHIHEFGVVHRDVKPENIIIQENGDVMLCDFGLANRLLSSSGATALPPLRSRSSSSAPASRSSTLPFLQPQQEQPRSVGKPTVRWRRPELRKERSESLSGTAEYLAPEMLLTGVEGGGVCPHMDPAGHCTCGCCVCPDQNSPIPGAQRRFQEGRSGLPICCCLLRQQQQQRQTPTAAVTTAAADSCAGRGQVMGRGDSCVCTLVGHSYPVDFWQLGLVVHEMLAGSHPFYHPDTLKMHERVLWEAPSLDLGRRVNLSIEALSLVRELLHKNPLERLGSRPDLRDVENHPFFTKYGVDWEALLR